MEAFGAAVSVLTVIQMTHKAVFFLYESHRTIKGANDDRLHIIRDLRDLERVLNRILDVVSDQGVVSRRDHVAKLRAYLESEDSPVVACKEEVAAIQEVLEKHKKSLTWPLRKKEVQERLQNIERYKSRLVAAMHASSIETILAVESILHSQSDMLASHIQKESETAVLAWLRCPDVQTNLVAAVEKRQPGTGEWLLQLDRFREWVSGPQQQFLWLTGLPGSGKTIISSTVIATLLKAVKGTGSAVVYFYFDFHVEEKREVGSLLRVAVAQLATQSKAAFEELRKLYQGCEEGQRQPTTDELLRVATQASGHFPTVYAVVDALDECRDPRKAVESLKQLCDARNVQVMAVSRKDADLERAMRGTPEIRLEGPKVDADIASYVRQRMLMSEYMGEWPVEEQEKVEGLLKSKAESMFRWVQCQLDVIEQCSDTDEIDAALASLPPDLPATYERILANVRQHQFRNIYRALTCLAFAFRPFTLDEVKCVLQVDPKAAVKLSRKIVFANQLLSACSSLVASGQGESMQLRLAHFSVKEYLISDTIARSPVNAFALSHAKGHREMAESCVACLIHFDSVEEFGPETLKRFPFLSYAANNWPHHSQLVNSEESRGDLDELVFELFHNRSGAYVNWHRLCSPTSPFRGIRWSHHIQEGDKRDKEWLMKRHRVHRPLYYAAMWNMWRVVDKLLRAGERANDWNLGNYSAMHIAATHASYESMDILLRVGKANINQGDWVLSRPLHRAANTKDPAVVAWLLQRGANPRSASRIEGTPLQAAAYDGSHEVVAALIHGGAGTDVVFEHHHNETVWLETPLQCAAYTGSIACMELLLQHGASPENYATNSKVGTALHAAALNGQLEAAKFLLARGVSPRLKTGHYGTVLAAAAYGEHKEVVEFLLDKGAPYDELGGDQSRPWGGLDVDERRTLVDEIISRAGEKLCPNLLEAAKRGSVRMVRHFISQGVDLEAKENFHLRSPLNWAAANGHLLVLKILSEAGASVHSTNRAAESPFVMACTGGHQEVAKYLLARGAKVNQRGLASRTGLMCAEMGGHTKLAAFLRGVESEGITFECDGKTYKYVATRDQCVVLD